MDIKAKCIDSKGTTLITGNEYSVVMFEEKANRICVEINGRRNWYGFYRFSVLNKSQMIYAVMKRELKEARAAASGDRMRAISLDKKNKSLILELDESKEYGAKMRDEKEIYIYSTKRTMKYIYIGVIILALFEIISYI